MFSRRLHFTEHLTMFFTTGCASLYSVIFICQLHCVYFKLASEVFGFLNSIFFAKSPLSSSITTMEKD